MCHILYDREIPDLLIRMIDSKSSFLGNYSLEYTDFLANHVKVVILRSFFRWRSKEAKSELVILALSRSTRAVRVL